MPRLAIAAVMIVIGFPVLADQECTEAKAEELSDRVIAYLEDNPGVAGQVEAYMSEIENEYGGEPSDAQTCEALEKLLRKLQSSK